MVNELRAAETAVRQAIGLCQTVQASIDGGVLEKNDRSPVTIADFGSQALVCRSLAADFPNDPVVGEEDAQTLRQPEQADFLDRITQQLAARGVDADPETICDWIDRGAADPCDRFWTLDPIDGTKGFLRGDQYAVALALIVDGQVEVAVLGCPGLGSPEDGGLVFSAIRGSGTRVAPASDPADSRPVVASDCTDVTQARLCESVEAAHSSHVRSKTIAQALGLETDPLKLDSQAKYATVADSGAEIYLKLPVDSDYVEKIWDHAAGSLVVSESGGTVSDTFGKPLDFSCGRTLSENIGVVVSNGPLHEQVVAAVMASATTRDSDDGH
tara:strand:+ start:183 stop:1166 length:984 start_codon:yes stop_codon:yes gene_type:complete